MPFLYGDTSQFPLEDNFIETMGVVTDACVALLRVDEDLEDLANRTEAAKGDAVTAQAQLDDVSNALSSALEGYLHDPEKGAKIASAIMQSARGVLERGRADIANRRERTVRELAAGMGSARGGVSLALETLFARHELPQTQWRVDWRAELGERPAAATVTGQTPFKLEVKMETDIAPSSPFARAPRIGELERGFTLAVPEAAGWLRKSPRVKRRVLDTFHVTEVEISAERASLVLRRSNKVPSPGLEIVVRSYGTSSPTVRRLTEAGPAAKEDAVSLAGDDIAAVKRLWKIIEKHVGGLEKRRARLVSATLDTRSVEELRRPALLAELIIGSVAGLVREIVQRSPASGELILKRDTGSGRREEIYVPRDELTVKIETLHSERRRMFDVFGLDDASAVTRDRKVIYDEGSAPVIEISQITEVASA